MVSRNQGVSFIAVLRGFTRIEGRIRGDSGGVAKFEHRSRYKKMACGYCDPHAISGGLLAELIFEVFCGAREVRGGQVEVLGFSREVVDDGRVVLRHLVDRL